MTHILWWLFCPACGWQTETPNTDCPTSACPKCRGPAPLMMSFTAEDWKKYGLDLTAGRASVRDLLPLASRRG